VIQNVPEKLEKYESQKWPSSELLRRVVWYKFTDVSVVPAATIRAVTLIAEAANTS
jgi:hypothetical protein